MPLFLIELTEDVIVALQAKLKDERSSPPELLQILALTAIDPSAMLLESAWRWMHEGEEIRSEDEQLSSGGKIWIPASRVGERVLYPRTHRRRVL